MNEPLFFIQNIRGGLSSAVFWKPGGEGYTSDIDAAWKVPLEKAMQICRNRPSEDFPVSAALVEKIATRTVSVDRLSSERLRFEKVAGRAS